MAPVAILESKVEAWRKLLSDHDIIGQVYKIVSNKLKRKTQLEDAKQLEIAL